MKKQVHQDVFIGFFCLALCLLIYLLCRDLPADAAMMPNLLDVLLLVLSLLILGQGIQKSKLPADQQGSKGLTWDGIKIPLITWGLVLAYVVLFNLAGYFVATAVMLVVLMRFMKRTSWPVIIAIDVIYLLVMYFVFARMLNVNIDNFGMLGRLL